MKQLLAAVGASRRARPRLASTAHAYLDVCNRTNRVLSYSYVYADSSCQVCNGNVCTNNPKPWKQELGFDRYEGFSWGGLHRHLAVVALMPAFIALKMELFRLPQGGCADPHSLGWALPDLVP